MSGIIIGGVAVLALSCIGTVLTGQRRRLEKVEQWERWIVKLQKQLKENKQYVDKAVMGQIFDVRRELRTRCDELEKASKRAAQVCQILVPLARAVKAGTDVAIEKTKEEVPGWEDLTARHVAPFATGCTYISG